MANSRTPPPKPSKSIRPTQPAPTARRAPEPITIPMRTLSPNDVYLNALYTEALKAAKSPVGSANVQFKDRTMGQNVLVALQDHPKPGKTYLITLPTESGVTQPFEVEPLPNYVFRVTLKKRP